MDAAKIAAWLMDNPPEWGRVAEFVAEKNADYARQIADVFRELSWEYEGKVTMSLDHFTTKELATYFSDYHKEVHGFRPRTVNLADRGAIMEGILDLNHYMEVLKSTTEGRARLVREGWVVEEV